MCVVGATKFQVVLLAHDSALGRGGKNDNGFGSVLPQLSLSLLGNPPGVYPVWRVMLDNPDMANPQKRDASALRLLSWLSFSLDTHTSALLAKLMKQLATEEENNPVSSVLYRNQG